MYAHTNIRAVKLLHTKESLYVCVRVYTCICTVYIILTHTRVYIYKFMFMYVGFHMCVHIDVLGVDLYLSLYRNCPLEKLVLARPC